MMKDVVCLITALARENKTRFQYETQFQTKTQYQNDTQFQKVQRDVQEGHRATKVISLA